AVSEAALGSLLRREGKWLAEVRESSTVGGKPAPRVRGRRVSQRVLEQFFLSLSLQLKAGVSVVSALNFGLEDSAGAGFRAVHADILERVQSGTPLSEAMALHPRTFSVVVTNLVKAGEASGRLGEVCDEIRHHFEWNDRILGDVKQALIYPIALVIAAVAFFFVVFTFFIPRFTGVLKELGVPLPWLTRVMIGVSDFVMAHLPVVILAVIAPPILAAILMRKSSVFADWVDALKLRMPILGPILSQASLGRLLHNLAALYRAGIPLLEALRLCQPLVGNRRIQQGIATVHRGVAAGRPLHMTMSQTTLFPPMVVQMTALGETTGTLDQSLQSVANYYDVIVPRAVKALFTLFEPVMILGLLLVVGTIVLSVFLPIASALGAK
ncbi:MAG: type II secretion system F family protein, partial [Limisphaerales bacterium]